MNITLAKATESDLEEVEKLFTLYMSEIAIITGSKIHPSCKRSVCDKLLNVYWRKDDHFPFLVCCDGRPIGFSLVRRYPQDQSLYDMGQFFIRCGFKGKGIGREAFFLTLNKFDGNWLTRVLLENDGALKFWEKVISERTNGEYLLSREADEGLNMNFIRYTI